MCVCFGDPCAQNFWIERLFWEIIVLIGSLVELHVGLHSCLCFSPLKKLVLKCGSTPLWYLIDTLVSVELLKPFSYRNPDSSSIPGGSIEKAPASSIAPRHLVDRSSFCSWIWFFVARYLLDTSAVEHYWKSYLNLHRNLSLISSISLDLFAPVHLPNTLSFTSNLFLKFSSSFFKFLYTS